MSERRVRTCPNVSERFPNVSERVRTLSEPLSYRKRATKAGGRQVASSYSMGNTQINQGLS